MAYDLALVVYTGFEDWCLGWPNDSSPSIPQNTITGAFVIKGGRVVLLAAHEALLKGQPSPHERPRRWSMEIG